MKDLLKKLLLPQDKANHMAYGLLIYTILALWNPIIGISIVLILAISKEVLDKFTGGTVDKWDLIVTIISPIILYMAEILYKV